MLKLQNMIPSCSQNSNYPSKIYNVNSFLALLFYVVTIHNTVKMGLYMIIKHRTCNAFLVYVKKFKFVDIEKHTACLCDLNKIMRVMLRVLC